jgi:hypothetical protein
MLSSKHASESRSERRSFIAIEVWTKDRWSFGRWQRGGFLVGQCTLNPRRRDVRDLISIDESKSVLRRDGNAVEDIQLWDLQDVFDRSELSLGRTHDGCAHFKCPIRDRSSVVHVPLLRFASQYPGHLIDDRNHDQAVPGRNVP